MERKSLVWLLLGIFSTIGGYLPTLWGADFFSFSGVITTAIGGLFGIWLAFKLSE